MLLTEFIFHDYRHILIKIVKRDAVALTKERLQEMVRTGEYHRKIETKVKELQESRAQRIILNFRKQGFSEEKIAYFLEIPLNEVQRLTEGNHP